MIRQTLWEHSMYVATPFQWKWCVLVSYHDNAAMAFRCNQTELNGRLQSWHDNNHDNDEIVIMVTITKMTTNTIMIIIVILLFLIVLLFTSTVSSVVIMSLNHWCWLFCWHEVSLSYGIFVCAYRELENLILYVGPP